MNSDTKATNRRGNVVAQASQAIERLLERISQDAQGGPPQATPQLIADLTALIERVREHYRVLADRQVLAALEAALGIEAVGGGASGHPAEEQEGRGEVLDALEALIRGNSNRGGVNLPSESDANELPTQTDAEPEAGQLFEGTVRLRVYPGGSMQRVIRFVEEISKRPQFRVLRMSGNPQREGAEIDLGLREPTPLLNTLLGMGHSAKADTSRADGIPAVTVHLFAAEVA